MASYQKIALNQFLQANLTNSDLDINNSTNKEEILVIDDTSANLKLVADFLEDSGFDVRIAKSGVQALKLLEKTSPDLILLDVMMPEIDGFETCRRLKACQKTQDIPVIFMTAVADFANPENKVKGLTLGAVDYISKPIQLEEVLARVNTHLHLRSLTQQLEKHNERLLQEIEERQKAEQALRSSAIRLHHQNKVLTELARNPVLHQGNLSAALKEITEATAQDIDVERASVWLFDETHTKIKCLDLFETSLNRHSAGGELATYDYPAYFHALTQEQLIVADDAHTAPQTQEFSQSYLTPLGIVSMLDAPIRLGGQTVGVLCSEHIGTTRHWTPEDQNFARSAADLVSLAIEARERKLAEEELRVSEVREREKATQLELALKELKRTQAQLIQAEKMSSLGRMVAGVAHEINNPVSFIRGNVNFARAYFQELNRLIELYQQTYPNPTPEIQQFTEEIELEFLVEDYSKLIDSMQVGAERIEQIVLSLKSFSRLGEAELKSIDIHEGIDNGLLMLQPCLRAQVVNTAGQGSLIRPAIKVIKDYSQLPRVTCYASQLNQVFMNLLNNAIDAIASRFLADAALENKPSEYVITISTAVDSHSLSVRCSNSQPTTNNIDAQAASRRVQHTTNYVVIRIADNGCGMSEEVQQKIFDPFFTTKPVGSGRGLGLFISHQIVVEKHKGQISCVSAKDKGTEFIVKIPIILGGSYILHPDD